MLFRDSNEALRAAIWRRFAVMDGERPLRCRGYNGKIDKIVFPTRDAALGAVAQLRTTPGESCQYVHPCPGTTHWHLTNTPNKEEEKRTVGAIGKKIKMAQNATGHTEWSASKLTANTPGKCPGCKNRYQSMSRSVLNAHAETYKNGRQRDCPTVG